LHLINSEIHQNNSNVMKKLYILVVEISSLLLGVALRIPHVNLCRLLSTSCKRILPVVCFVSGPVRMPALRLDHTNSIEKKIFHFQ